jgi:ubiquitin C-terminal hydrolase
MRLFLDKCVRLLRAHRLARPKSTRHFSVPPSVSKRPSGESQHDPSAPNESRRTLFPLRGLKNLNLTCYLNATLPMLFTCFDVMNALRETEYGPDATLISAVSVTEYDVKCRLSSIPNKSRIFMDEIDTIIFAERKQHDAQELLSCVLDCFHGELTEKALGDSPDSDHYAADALCPVQDVKDDTMDMHTKAELVWFNFDDSMTAHEETSKITADPVRQQDSICVALQPCSRQQQDRTIATSLITELFVCLFVENRCLLKYYEFKIPSS